MKKVVLCLSLILCAATAPSVVNARITVEEPDKAVLPSQNPANNPPSGFFSNINWGDFLKGPQGNLLGTALRMITGGYEGTTPKTSGFYPGGSQLKPDPFESWGKTVIQAYDQIGSNDGQMGVKPDQLLGSLKGIAQKAMQGLAKKMMGQFQNKMSAIKPSSGATLESGSPLQGIVKGISSTVNKSQGWNTSVVDHTNIPDISTNIGAITKPYNSLLNNVAKNAPNIQSVLSSLNNSSVNAAAGKLTQILMGFNPADLASHAASKTQKRTRSGWIPYVLFDIAQTANVAGILVPSVVANSGTKAMKSTANVKLTQVIGSPSPEVYPDEASKQAQEVATDISEWTRDGQLVTGKEDIGEIKRSLVEALFVKGNCSDPYDSKTCDNEQDQQAQQAKGASNRFSGYTQEELNKITANRHAALSKASREAVGKAAEQLKNIEEMIKKMETVQESANNSKNLNADLLVNAMAIQLQNMVIIKNILAQSQTLGVKGLGILSKTASYTIENPNNLFPDGGPATKGDQQ